jgi:glycosyltransferase involved in cell wall biosynthesis
VTHTILHVIPSLARGGIVTQVLQLVANLPRDEIAQRVVALDHNCDSLSEFRDCGVDPIVLGQRGSLDLIAFWQFRRLVSQLRPQIIHPWSPEALQIAAMPIKMNGVGQLVASERRIRRTLVTRFSPVDRWLTDRPARFVVNSEAVRLNCLARGIDSGKVSTIAGGVAIPEVSAPIAAPSIKTELNLPESAKLIACVGSLTVDKRLKELIWAIDQLQAVSIEAHLLVIGEGRLKQRLERYAWLNRVQHRVHFLGSRADVPSILQQCDVLWHAAANEGESSAILEAMAAGLPVVAADSGGTRELVVPGETGFLVPLGERAGFARWTLPLLENPEQAKQLGATGRERARTAHSIDQAVAQFAKLYREVSEKSR